MSRLTADGVVVQGRGPYALTVEPGECVSLRGASGAGKTLFLRALADLDRHEGAVRLGGVEAQAMSGPEWRRRVGLLFAESAWWAPRVGDHFRARDDAELDALGLPPSAWRFDVARLSTGERQRLALLRLLAMGPDVLLLDEPTASLDEASVGRVEARVRAYREARESPVVWVTHDPRQAERVATRHFELTVSGLVALDAGGSA